MTAVEAATQLRMLDALIVIVPFLSSFAPYLPAHTTIPSRRKSAVGLA
jgi:hypothetical protein